MAILNKRFSVAITDAEYPSHEPELEVLSKLNVELIKYDCKTEDDVIKNCKYADAILNQYAPITRRVIGNLVNAKVIVRYGIGVDNIDVDAATERGIFVANVVYDISDVADHTVALMLLLVRKILRAFEGVKSGVWDWKKLQPIPSFKNLTVGIIGFGRIGQEVAKRISSFGAKIIAYDPYLQHEIFQSFKVDKTDLDDLLQYSDIVTLHVALSKDTYHLIGVNELKKMKNTAILINVSRGAVVDEKALYMALKEKWIAGAAMDVLEKEPPQTDNPLIHLDNVIITPHMAWYSTSSLLEIQKKAAEEVLRVLSGQIPVNLVNKEVLKKINLQRREE